MELSNYLRRVPVSKQSVRSIWGNTETNTSFADNPLILEGLDKVKSLFGFVVVIWKTKNTVYSLFKTWLLIKSQELELRVATIAYWVDTNTVLEKVALHICRSISQADRVLRNSLSLGWSIKVVSHASTVGFQLILGHLLNCFSLYLVSGHQNPWFLFFQLHKILCLSLWVKHWLFDNSFISVWDGLFLELRALTKCASYC